MTILHTYLREIIGGVVIVAVLALGLHQLGEAREARGEAEAFRTQVEAAVVRIGVLEDSLTTVDQRAADSIARLNEAREEAERREDAAQAEAGAARERVRDATSAVDSLALPDSARTLIEAERAEREAEVAALMDVIGSLRDRLAVVNEVGEVQRTQIEARDDLIRELREGIETARAESDAWERAANPGFFGKVVGWVPPLIVGFGIGMLATL